MPYRTIDSTRIRFEPAHTPYRRSSFASSHQPSSSAMTRYQPAGNTMGQSGGGRYEPGGGGGGYRASPSRYEPAGGASYRSGDRRGSYEPRGEGERKKMVERWERITYR